MPTLYTVPSNSRAIVKSINVAEDAAGSAVVKVTLTNAAGTAFVVDNDVSLTAGLKEQVLTEPLIMEESEALKVQATSGSGGRGCINITKSIERIDNAICRNRGFCKVCKQ